MPAGEEMFKFHGYSGPCPKEPLPRIASGIELIAQERRRQIDAEGWTPEHDDEHVNGELIASARCYAKYAQYQPTGTADGNHPQWWPWDDEHWKPSPDPIRNLVKAGALIAAEIDRLQRKG